MAKKRRRSSGGESVSGYFRSIFEKRPHLLDSGSNKELLNRWLQDHPGIEKVPENVKQNLANLKSVLRKKARQGKFITSNDAAPAPAPARATTASAKILESLEERIDECLTIARAQDREVLSEVIKLLRYARNKVVWMMG
jgi:hypothetical protein